MRRHLRILLLTALLMWSSPTVLSAGTHSGSRSDLTQGSAALPATVRQPGDHSPLAQGPPASAPFASPLDLSHWNFDADGPAALTGPWEFYWGELYSPQDLARLTASPGGYLFVPGSWKGYQWQGARLPGEGFATLRLQIQVPELRRSLALELPHFLNSYRLWVNGELVAQAGTVGRSAAASVPEYRVQTVLLPAGQSKLELVLQVSSFGHRDNLTRRPILLGDPQQMSASRDRHLVWRSLLIGGMLVLSSVNLLYWLQNRTEVKYLYFGLICLVLAIFDATENALILHNLGPGTGWVLRLRVIFAVGYLNVFLGVRLLHHLLPAEVWRHGRRLADIVALTGLAAVSVLPMRVITETYRIGWAVMAVTLLYVLWVVAQGIRNGRSEAWSLMLGAAAMSGGLLLYILVGPILPQAYMSLGTLVWLLLMIVPVLVASGSYRMLTRSRSELLQQNIKLAESLKVKLAELRSARQLLAAHEEERNRSVAEFLHSRVQSKLVAIGHRIRQVAAALPASESAASIRLQTAVTQLEEMREQDIRRASHLLHPLSVSIGLGVAIETLLADHGDQIQTTLTISKELQRLDDPRANAIPESVRLIAYRVLSEALANVLAHAQASRIAIELGLTEAGHLMISVSDNGCGFDPERTPTGLGMKTIVARLAECGGTLQVNSVPEEGTRLVATIPLEIGGSSTAAL